MTNELDSAFYKLDTCESYHDRLMKLINTIRRQNLHQHNGHIMIMIMIMIRILNIVLEVDSVFL